MHYGVIFLHEDSLFLIVAFMWYFLSPQSCTLRFHPSLIRFCMTNSFTWVSSIKLKSALPVVSIRAVRCHQMTHSPLALILHTPGVYKAKTSLYYLILIDPHLLLLLSILGDTHAHLCIHRCRSNRLLLSNLDPLENRTRSVEQLCIGPDILTYISSFVLMEGKQKKVEKPIRWSLGCHNAFVLLFRDQKVS